MMAETPAILISWTRSRTEHGFVMAFDLAATGEDARLGRLRQTRFVLNDRQLRSLARDLVRAAEDRGLDIFHQPRGWRRVTALLRGDKRR